MTRTLLSASMRMTSPSSMRAMGPPVWASGATWPITKPCDPPEKRPSVMSATQSPRPAPMMALVGVSISGMPGPPFGPSYRMTTTHPRKDSGSSSRAASMASSWSKQRAGPSNSSPSLPVIFATDPSGATSPYRICRWPVSLMGLLRGITTSWPSLKPGHISKFSAMVFPVTVMHDPSIIPSSRRNFKTAGVPPTVCRSSITYFPEGLRSARKGVLSLMRWKSSSVISTPTLWAIAMRWSTAFVDPPSAMMTTIAFSKAAFVMMSRGRMSFSSRFRTAWPTILHSSIFSGSSAGMLDE
mmetsp:Transcript_3241/g.7979  ORF Transcript_3241/g.7979 Transcript_3241/m.7979 type:complete len:298 (+) Transcript_3241:342-1235(+)